MKATVTASFLFITATLLLVALSLRGSAAAPNLVRRAPVYLSSPSNAKQVGKIREFADPTQGADALGITAGPDGALWFAEAGASAIGRMTTSGVYSEYKTPTANSGPADIVVGPDGALWFTEAEAGNVGRITANGTITEYPASGCGPDQITVGSDSALWYTGCGSYAIGRMTTSGQTSIYPVGEHILPGSITSGPDGALWFTDDDSDSYWGYSIVRMTTQGDLTVYSIPTKSNQPEPVAITSGPDHALWFTAGYSSIWRLSVKGQFSSFATSEGLDGGSIARGPNGSLWFTAGYPLQYGYNYGIAGFVLPDTTSYFQFPHESKREDVGILITEGPDHAMWFTETSRATGNSVIGRIRT